MFKIIVFISLVVYIIRKYEIDIDMLDNWIHDIQRYFEKRR